MNHPWMKKIKQFERMYFLLYEIRYPAQLLKIHEVKKKYLPKVIIQVQNDNGVLNRLVPMS